jgi:EAL domain-containing protein (putative c-di-GMP-specific phosphodiesterase class I)
LQPQCEADGRIVGAEALMRWRHAERGFVAPSDFIPVAERSGLIIPAGQRVLDDVCRAMLRWQQIDALRDIAVSVNVSRVQLTPGTPVARLVDAVPASLSNRGLIKFELTESMFVEDFDATCQLLEGIRARGIRISLDDFGTGFSSLSYLRRLPLDDLKLDQSFVRQLPADRTTEKIARSIVGLGHDLGLDVIAEGVENPSQLQALQAMGCTCFQGFLFSRPVTLQEFERLVLEDVRRDRHAPDGSGEHALAPA